MSHTHTPNLLLYKPKDTSVRDDTFADSLVGFNSNADIVDALFPSGVLSLAKGGTAKALTASNGGIVYSDSDSFEILSGTATAQKLLMSQANVAPIWSTPTYPNIGTLGKVLIGDGTNVVLSTPKYPNASVTAGKVIISDGTDYIASTPTYPNVATGTGKILRADGTNWVASTPTYPNTAVSGKFLRGDGTNWIESTPTLPNTATLGKLLIGDGTNVVLSTPKYPNASVTAGKVIISDGTDYASSTFTIPDTMAISTILYASAANVLSALATGNSGILVTSAGGVPSIATDIPTAVTIGTKYIYRAEGTDIPVADGGTGLSTVASGSVLIANALNTVSALTWASAGTKMLVNTSGVLSMETVTGTGAPVLANTPTLITPVLGVATATSITAISNAGLGLYEDGGAGIFVKDGGYVGIGVTNPLTPLHLKGSIELDHSVAGTSADLTIIPQTTGYATLGTLIIYPASGTNVCSGINIVGKGAGLSSIMSQFLIFNTDQVVSPVNYAMGGFRATTDMIICGTGKSGTATSKPMMFATRYLEDGATNANQVYLATTGKVGILTATPSAQLAINGGLHVGGDSDPGDNNLSVDGYIGVGNSSPSVKLDLTSADNAQNGQKIKLGYDAGAGEYTYSIYRNIMSGMLVIDGVNSAGTQYVGVSLNGYIGFYGKTPVAQPTGIAAQKINYTAGDLDTEAEIITALNTTNTAINALRTALNNLGLTTVV